MWREESSPDGKVLAKLQQLLDDDLPALRLSGFRSPRCCADLAHGARRRGLHPYRGQPDASSVKKLGPSQSEFASKEDYFAAVSRDGEQIQELATAAGDVLASIASEVRAQAGVGVELARDSIFGPYSPAIVQSTAGAGLQLHVDFAPLDAPGWDIAAVTAQLSWNLFLEAPESGGECEIFRRQWRPHHEGTFRVPRSYHYDSTVVASHDICRVCPQVGDLVIFNSRNYHRVLPNLGPRTTLTAFLGLKPEGGLVAWS